MFECPLIYRTGNGLECIEHAKIWSALLRYFERYRTVHQSPISLDTPRGTWYARAWVVTEWPVRTAHPSTAAVAVLCVAGATPCVAGHTRPQPVGTVYGTMRHGM